MANLDKSAGVAGGPLGTLAGRGCWGTAGDTGWQVLLGDRAGATPWLAGADDENVFACCCCCEVVVLLFAEIEV